MKIFQFNPRTLRYELVNPKKIIIYFLTIFLILFILGWWTGTTRFVVNKITHINKITDTLLIPTKKFSKTALITLLQNSNIKYPYIVLAQAELESSNFTSKLFKTNHNMFGMKYPKQRITTAENQKDGYAYYRDWIDCVHDYAMWQSLMTCEVTNEDQYFNKLSERYAEDTLYVSKLKNIITKEKLKRLFIE